MLIQMDLHVDGLSWIDVILIFGEFYYPGVSAGGVKTGRKKIKLNTCSKNSPSVK